jgi:uncharacterized membrane protein YhiD involved in acid resistance
LFFVARGSVYGLTAAASLYITASIGVTARAGMYWIAAAGILVADLIVTC